MNHPTTPSNFNTILSLIKTAKDHIVKTVNTEIIDLYWQIGREVSEKVKNGGWGKSVVEELSSRIAANFGDLRSFSPQNIWRMKQFYETYQDSQILSTVLRELSWSNNLLVMSRAKNDPVLVAEYTAQLPDKKLLQNKLRELKDLESI